MKLVKESLSENFKNGDLASDYNDTIVKVIDVGSLGDMLKKIQELSDAKTANEELEMLEEIELSDLSKKFYLTKAAIDNESVPIEKDTLLLYPYEYDYANYYGLEKFHRENVSINIRKILTESLEDVFQGPTEESET